MMRHNYFGPFLAIVSNPGARCGNGDFLLLLEGPMARHLSESDLDLLELYALRISCMKNLDPTITDIEDLKCVLDQVRIMVDELRELRRRTALPGESRTFH